MAQPIKVILDTDCYNEVDDQFALAYGLMAREVIDIQAIYAAPFSNERAATPLEGMTRSYKEIIRILGLMKKTRPVFKGADDYISDAKSPINSEAVVDLIQRARATSEELTVIGIGAATNIASAIAIAPDIVPKIKVLWLGTNGTSIKERAEFNYIQDPAAAEILFNSGVSLVLFPCCGVCSHLITTTQELNHYLCDSTPIAGYLLDIVTNYKDSCYGWSKVLWDIATIGYLCVPEAYEVSTVNAPVITSDHRLDYTADNYQINRVDYLKRDMIFSDMFRRLSGGNY